MEPPLKIGILTSENWGVSDRSRGTIAVDALAAYLTTTSDTISNEFSHYGIIVETSDIHKALCQLSEEGRKAWTKS